MLSLPGMCLGRQKVDKATALLHGQRAQRLVEDSKARPAQQHAAQQDSLHLLQRKHCAPITLAIESSLKR